MAKTKNNMFQEMMILLIFNLWLMVSMILSNKDLIMSLGALFIGVSTWLFYDNSKR